MPIHAAPLLVGGSLLGILALALRSKTAPAPGRTPQSTPENDKPVVPPPPPKPNTFPAGTQTAVVIAPHGVNVRDQADERGSKVLVAVPQYERVAILDGSSPPLAATPAAPQGWWKVTTLSGVTGYASAQWLFFGTDAEARMSDAEFQKQQEEHQNDETPTFQGWPSFGACCGSCAAGGPCISGCPGFGAAPSAGSRRPAIANVSTRSNPFPALTRAVADMRARTARPLARPDHRIPGRPDRRPARPGAVAWYVQEPALGRLRCVAPSGCYLRVQGPRGGLVPSGVVVENGGLVLALQRIPGPKQDPASPASGGFTLARVTDSMTGRVVDGWLPSEWLVSA